MKFGRNDPCPCGSGKKYKRCCLVNDEASQTANRTLDNEWLKLRRTEGEMVHLLLHVARDWHGEDFLKNAWQEYTRTANEPIDINEAPEAQTSLIPWAVFDYVPPKPEAEADSLPDFPVALSFLFTADHDLMPHERQFITAMCGQPYSFWSVQEAWPGKSLKLRNLFTGVEDTVKELKASEVLKKGDIVYTRVVSMGRTAIMVGLAPYTFPPNYHFEVLEAREILFGRQRKIAPQKLLACEPLLRQVYFGLRRRLLNPVMPVLQNTDGDPLEFVKLNYQLNCAPRTAFEKLRSLNPFASEEELLADAERDESGTLRSLKFDWLKQGNKMHYGWDNTIMGNVSIAEGELVIDVNSVKRAEKIQAEIRKRLGDSAILKDSRVESLEQKLAELEEVSPEAQQGRREEQEAFAALPEVQAQIKKMAAQHWAEWLDRPVPVLKGKTPKQAAKSAAGRERLEALLTDFERKVEVNNDPFAPNVTELRTRLGLAPGPATEKARQNRRASPNQAQSDGVPL